MMDRSGVKSINTSVTFIQVAPTQPTSCFSFSQLNKVISRPATQTSPHLSRLIPHDRAQCGNRKWPWCGGISIHLLTGLPECIKVIALSLHCNSLRGRTAPPTPCSSSLLWRGVPAVRHKQLAPFHSHDTYGYGLAWNNEMEPHLSQVGMNASEDIKRISWLWMFM